jgi:hypothetical protein
MTKTTWECQSEHIEESHKQSSNCHSERSEETRVLTG